MVPKPLPIKTTPAKRLIQRPMVIVGGILTLVLGVFACSQLDDDDCDSMGTVPGEQVFAAGFSGIRAIPPSSPQTSVVPKSGGFGTHLASCGG